jgi:hypothetical protein
MFFDTTKHKHYNKSSMTKKNPFHKTETDFLHFLSFRQLVFDKTQGLCLITFSNFYKINTVAI